MKPCRLLFALAWAAATAGAAPAAAESAAAAFARGLSTMERYAAAPADCKSRAARSASPACWMLDTAVGDFRAAVKAHPTLPRPRLELGRALFLRGNYSAAKRQFRAALNTGLPPVAARRARAWLETIRERQCFQGRVSFAMLPDSNPGNATSARSAEILGRTFVLNEDARAREGVGLRLAGDGSYQRPLGERMWLQLGAAGSRREYGGSNYDETTATARAELAFPWASGHTTAGLEWSNYWLGEDSAVGLPGLRADWLRPLAAAPGRERRWLRLGASLHHWQQQRGSGQERNGPQFGLSVALGGSRPRWRWQAGLGVERMQARADWARRSSYRVQGGVSRETRGGSVLSLLGALRFDDYDAGHPLQAGTRKQRDTSGALTLQARHRKLTFHGFSPQVSITYEHRDSSFDLRDSRALRGELNFAREF